MAKLSDVAIKKLVRKTLSEKIGGVEIVEVILDADDYIDGERVLRISVVFDSKTSTPDRRATASVLRNLIPKMGSLEESGFPLLSFIAASERRNFKSDPA